MEKQMQLIPLEYSTELEVVEILIQQGFVKKHHNIIIIIIIIIISINVPSTRLANGSTHRAIRETIDSLD
jgi:hypothetical protein